MAGPSSKVQGGYLGYSALTDSYWNTLNRVRRDQTQRLENEKLELANEEAINEQFQLPGVPTGSATSQSRGGKSPTVVTNSGFSYTANINDPALMEYLTPQQIDLNDPAAVAQNNYRKTVANNQKQLFKGEEFKLDGSALQAGGGFNAALQGSLEGLKGAYVKAGRRTSPRKRREERLAIRGQLGALQSFSGEVQGLQQAYKQAFDAGMISHGTKSEFIDFLNTISGPNDLQVQWDNGRGFLAGTSAAGQPISLPLDNVEALKNGLVLKQNNPAPLVDKLVKEVNAVREGIDERGVKTQNNDWTEETTNNVQSQLNQLVPDSKSILSMGIDWLGFDGPAWKAKVDEDPSGAKQVVLDALSAHVKSQWTPTQKGGLTEDQLVDNTLNREKFDETKRRNRVLEGQAQQRLDKPGKTPKADQTPEQQAKFMQGLLQELSFIKPGQGEKDVFLSGLSGGKVKNAAYRAPTRDTKDQFPDGYYEVNLAGGGKNLIDVNDKQLLLEYIAEAEGISPELIGVYAQQLGGGQSNSNQSRIDAIKARLKKG